MGQTEEPPVEALAAKGVLGGTAFDRSGDQGLGVLSVMVIPPHAKDPRARIRLTLNAATFVNPDQLLDMAEQFSAIAQDQRIVEAFDTALSMEDEAQQKSRELSQQTAMMGAMGG